MPTLSSNIVKREVASVADVEEALARQALYGGDLATNLLELASISEERLTAVIAESLEIEAAPAGELPTIGERVRRLVPRDIAQRYALFPLEESEGRLLVAIAEPLPPEVVSDLEFSLGLPLLQRATTLVRVQQAVARDYGVELDQRAARVLARLSGKPDPHPSVFPIPLDSEAPAATPFVDMPDPVALSPDAMTPDLKPGSVHTLPGAQPPTEPPPEEIAPKPARLPKVDWVALARAERSNARRPKRTRGPYTIAMAEADLLKARTRDDVVAAFFHFTAQFFEYAALFQVHGDLAEGRDAHGAGAPRAKVLAIGVPLDLPSTLAEVVAAEPYRLARLAASGLDAALAKDLDRRPGRAVLLLPIRVRNRAVLVLYGDHGDADVDLREIGEVLSFAPLVSTALERLILRWKEQARGGSPRDALAFPVEQRAVPRGAVARTEARASALASLVEPSAMLRPSSLPPAEVDADGSSFPPLARPVISIGPRPPEGQMTTSAPPGTARSASLSPLALPSKSRTPIPSSFAPGAPPHSPRPEPRTVLGQGGEERAVDDAGYTTREPGTKPGVGSTPPFHRSATPIQMPPPPGLGGVLPPETTRSPALPTRDAEDEGWSDSAPPPPPDAAAPHDGPELSIATSELDTDFSDEEAESQRFAEAGGPPRSRSVAHSARPLPAPGSAQDLRLPTVIVDLAQDTEELVGRLTRGDQVAAERLVQIGAAAVPALVGAFPGPITAELRRGVGDGPPRASECGPLLRVLARIGPKAAGVLSVRSNDKEPLVRAWATRLLGEMPCMDSARAVARRFIDEDAEVRRAALAAGRMLQSHANSSAILASTLVELLLDSNRNDRSQHMVIEAVADLREARAIPMLTTLLAAGSPEIQRSAHWALVVLSRTDHGDNAAAWEDWWRLNEGRHRIEWLIDALMHEGQEIRRAAGDELKSQTKEYFGYYDDLPARERERAQKRYRDWWDTKGKARFA